MMRPGDTLLEAMTGLACCVQTSYRGRPLDETKVGNGAGLGRGEERLLGRRELQMPG